MSITCAWYDQICGKTKLSTRTPTLQWQMYLINHVRSEMYTNQQMNESTKKKHNHLAHLHNNENNVIKSWSNASTQNLTRRLYSPFIEINVPTCAHLWPHIFASWCIWNSVVVRVLGGGRGTDRNYIGVCIRRTMCGFSIQGSQTFWPS